MRSSWTGVSGRVSGRSALPAASAWRLAERAVVAVPVRELDERARPASSEGKKDEERLGGHRTEDIGQPACELVPRHGRLDGRS